MDSITQLEKFADERAKERDYDTAISMYSSVLVQSQTAERTDTLKKRSSCYFQVCNYVGAFDDINEVLKLSPDWIAGYHFASKCLVNIDDHEGVCELYRKGLEKNPDNAKLKQGLNDAKQKMNVGSFEATCNNPLTLCKQDYYPGDDVLLEEEKVKLDCIGQSKIQRKTDQSDERSLPELVQESWKHKQDGDLKKAIRCLNKAVESTKDNSCLCHVLAELFYQDGDFEESLRCLTVIPSKARSYDTWLLGGKTLQKLGLPVSAEMWLRHAAKFGGKRQELAALLFQDIRAKRLYEKLVTGKMVEVRFTENGRALFAKEDIPKGQKIFSDSPVLLAQTNDSADVRACSNCAKNLESAVDYFGKTTLNENPKLLKITEKYWPNIDVISCPGCDHEVYCSDTCRQSAWNEHHQILCTSVNKNVNKLYEVCDQYQKLLESKQRVLEGIWSAAFSPMLLARVWAAVASEAKRQAESRGLTTPETRDWIRAKLPYRRFIAYGPSSYAEMVPKMVKIMQNIFNNPTNGAPMEISDREFDGRYFQIACNVQAFSDPKPPFRIFMEHVKAEGLEKDVSPYRLKKERFATFGGLFPLQASMNHSCDNNTEIYDGEVTGKPGVTATANRNIKKGEEINITYIDTRMSRQERRGWLIRSYNFWCQCPRCRFEGDDSSFCTQCNKQTTEDKNFPACGKCRNAWYCSPKCQKTAWKNGHKTICRKR